MHPSPWPSPGRSRSAGWANDAPITVAFAGPVRVSRVVVVVYNDGPRTYNAAQRGRALLRRGTRTLAATAWTPLDRSPVLLCGTDDHLVLGAAVELRFPRAVAGDRVVIELRKRPQATQLLLREVQIWGLPERLANAPPRALPCTVGENTYSSLRVTWKTPLAGTQYVRVRYRAVGDGAWWSRCYSASPAVIGWLQPATVYEACVDAVGVAGGGAGGEPGRVLLPAPLALRQMGDLWGMNFYPGGGGAHQAHPDETADTQAMIGLMSAAGVRHVRWWLPSPGGAELLAEARLSLFPTFNATSSAAYAQLTRTTGAWLVGLANEPDFAGIAPAGCARAARIARRAAKAFSPLFCLAAPALGGELVGPGGDWLAEAYANNLRDGLDALDLHPYVKRATPVAPGGVLGGPESLLASFGAGREVLEHAHDPHRPIVVSEAGHPTYQGDWHIPAVSHERQAQWVVRSHLLLASLGVRRIFWYAFQDEGTDRAEPEHNFGMVDWHGQPKPAYRAYAAMTRQLSRARCLGHDPGFRTPRYGVRCALGGAFVTAVWDSGGRSSVQMRAKGVTRLVSLTGAPLALPPVKNGLLTLTLDESVRYVYSTEPLRITAQERLEPDVAPQMQMSLSPTTVRVKPGGTARLAARLQSGYDGPVTVTVSTGSPWGGPVEQRRSLAARAKDEVVLELPVPAGAKPGTISWDVGCRVEPADPRWPGESFRRAVFFVVR
ncbi:MAG: fibronectin type III domain-containing protein [Armatimonadetes bacterium]|nr:fibronectin type III domain-containing protein [Armatimonadota bacterium]